MFVYTNVYVYMSMSVYFLLPWHVNRNYTVNHKTLETEDFFKEDLQLLI